MVAIDVAPDLPLRASNSPRTSPRPPWPGRSLWSASWN